MHNLKLFVGARSSLKKYHTLAPERIRAFALTPDANIFVMPLDDDLHDILHAAYGTGEWLGNGLQLSTGDLTFAARASQGAVLAYLETEYFGGAGSQSAVAWTNGEMRLKPATFNEGAVGRRPLSLMPINTALKILGIVPTSGRDAFETLGLDNYRRGDDICRTAIEIKL